tara:strand:- start:3093 stop:4118 length:1026 start_codon:yes stop_codon:yes gene_type:complete
MNFYLLILLYFVVILTHLYLYIKICQKHNICKVYDSINEREVIQSAGMLIILFLPLFFLVTSWIYPDIKQVTTAAVPRPHVFIFNIIVLGLVSFYDDIKILDFRYRLVIQFFIAFLSLSLFIFPITEFLPIKLEQILMIFFIIFIVNATNFYDGLDGMLNINTIFVCLAVLIVSYYEQKLYISTAIAIALLPIVVCLLPFNFPTAKIFMGDTGSVVIGYAMSIILIDLLTNKLYWIFLIVYFIPSTDVIFTIIKKIKKKIDPWERLFDYIFLVPVITFKKKHTFTTIPFLICNLINLFLIVAAYHFKTPELLLISFAIGIAFLFYCWNCNFFSKKNNKRTL